jgi:xylulose-5-phosphate/fructose-6-phosphate phosphoketolase
MQDRRLEAREWTREYGEDAPEIREWTWPAAAGKA